jgi:hypothetical protein
VSRPTHIGDVMPGVFAEIDASIDRAIAAGFDPKTSP